MATPQTEPQKEPQKPPPTVEELRDNLIRLGRTGQFLMPIAGPMPFNAHIRAIQITHVRSLAELAREADLRTARAAGYTIWDLDYDKHMSAGEDFERLSRAVQRAAERKRFK